MALESSWASDALPRDIVEKSRFRRDKAAARYDVLMTDFESVAPILFPDNGAAIERVQYGVFTAFSNRIYLDATESFFMLKRGLFYFFEGFLGPFVAKR